MKPKLREILDTIDRFLANKRNQNDYSAKHLWHVLTALRGPDSGSLSQKGRTTVYIRAKAFPKTAKMAALGAFRPLGAVFSGIDPFVWPKENDHFGAHIRLAARVLGLGMIDD